MPERYFVLILSYTLLGLIRMAGAFLPSISVPIVPYSGPYRTSTILHSAVLDGPQISFGRGQTVNPLVTPSIDILRVTRSDLRAAAALCIESFFGRSGNNPMRALQLTTLLDEQLEDLAGRFCAHDSCMLQAIDKERGQMVGFVELSLNRALKYGLGPGIPERDERPYLANLSVKPNYRRQGIGSKLVKACEEIVTKKWRGDEIILQVEDTNLVARRMYKDLGYTEIYTDDTGRKYAIEGFSIKSVRVNKIAMRRQLVVNPISALLERAVGAY